ncbi:LysR family transcriptional regulator [Zavarzinia sp.]|uniref:LysR family transcriptional regulator n=1 Tax=Zavarzinia sp. TaxID=2027920 RepID=UPI00356A298D
MTDAPPGWDHYRSLLAVLETGSLSAAARHLGLTQPTLGHHIAALEAALGVPLFTRSPRGLQPTATARLLRPHAEAMAAAEGALRRAASAEAGGERGTVRITASEVVGGLVLPPYLAEFRRRHPGIVLELSLSNLSEDLLHQAADIAIRMVTPRQEALVARPLGEIHLGLYARADYLAAAGTPARLEDIAGHALIGPDRDRAVLRGLGVAALAPEAFTLRLDDQAAQFAFIRAGYGIGVCQCGLAAREPGLVRLLPEAFEARLPVWLVCHEDLRASRRVRLVFDFLAEALADYIVRGG